MTLPLETVKKLQSSILNMDNLSSWYSSHSIRGKSKKYSILPFQNKQKITKQETIKLEYYLLPIEK